MQLIEHYLSLQGEGLRAGVPTYFVRFARCNLRCTWCDSAYTFGGGKTIDFSAVVRAIHKSSVQYVCLTGGEPLLHLEDCQKLMRHLKDHHFDIETGGALDIKPAQLKNSSIMMDWKLKSSNMGHTMRSENLKQLRPGQDLLKFVTDGSVSERNEIQKILKEIQNKKIEISIQPVHGTPIRPLAQWALSLKYPFLRFNLQLHKLIWPLQKKGV